jgi:hypothetical protein
MKVALVAVCQPNLLSVPARALSGWGPPR